MDNLRERVSRVIAEQFHVSNERITEAATLDEDLGATSIDRVEVVMALEDEFKIDISDDQALGMHTVADVLACVTANVARLKSAPARLPG
jgi:acyl carrier protein